MYILSFEEFEESFEGLGGTALVQCLSSMHERYLRTAWNSRVAYACNSSLTREVKEEKPKAILGYIV